MKVICINPPDKELCRRSDIKPLEFLKEYTVRYSGEYHRGPGYLLEEVKNKNVVDAQREISYAASRFIPISEVQEAVKQLTADSVK